MKSKRFLTILLSLAIMLTFMPSMAFAISEGTAEEGHDFTILADESNVEWTIAPTCTTPGYGVVTCTKSHGGVPCKATKNVKKAALGHEFGDDIVVTAAEFAAQMVKEGMYTEADAKLWLDNAGKQICTGTVHPCKNCGFYLHHYSNSQQKWIMDDFDSFYNSRTRTTEHVAPAGTKACAATFDCFVCGQKGVSNTSFNATTSAEYHGIDLATGNWTLNNNFKVKKDEYKAHTVGNSGNRAVYVTVYECKECGLEEKTHRMAGSYDITDFEHPSTITDTVAATCETPGYTKTVCADCGYTLASQGTPELGHKWSEETVYPANEAHGDLAYNVCTVCGKIDWDTEKEVTAKLDHNLVSTVYAPNSCSNCTWILVQCTNCGDYEFVDDENKAIKKGSKYYITFDGKDVEVPFADATGHNWGDKQTIHEATCTEGAEEARVCTVCGAINHNSVREISKPLGHDVEEVVVAPTCGEAGYSYKICNRCNNYLRLDGNLGKTPADFEAAKYAPTNPVVKLGAKCQYEWKTLEEATPFKLGTRAKVCTVCNNELAATKESIAKTKIAAPKVKALKKKAKVTVKAVEGAVEYQILVNGKVVKKNAKAGKTYTIKKNLKLGKKNKFQIVAFDADGVKATSKAKSVKIKKK